jgi:hypothetical protein
MSMISSYVGTADRKNLPMEWVLGWVVGFEYPLKQQTKNVA